MAQDALEIYNEGYYYYTATNGYPLNYTQAFARFSTAAQMGLSSAMNYLGLMYLEGKGVPQNYIRAIEWFAYAMKATPTDFHAVYNLGRVYLFGWGVPKDYSRAKEYFELAIKATQNYESPYAYCCYMLGLIYSDVYKDYKKAAAHFQEAIRKGNVPEAYYSMGYLIECHGLTPANVPKENRSLERDKSARDYYEVAAKNGIVEAMDGLARMNLRYHQDEVALYWLRKAASMGYEPSKRRLQMLEAKESGSLRQMGKSILNFFDN